MVMGGSVRLSNLRNLFSTLTASGVECLVCTEGYVGPVNMILAHVGLSQFISQVYGMTGNIYGMSEYDRTAKPSDNMHYAGGPQNHMKRTKQSQVECFMQQRGFDFEDVVYIDDDFEEIASMSETCKAIHVRTAGLCFHDIMRIIQLAHPCLPRTKRSISMPVTRSISLPVGVPAKCTPGAYDMDSQDRRECVAIVTAECRPCACEKEPQGQTQCIVSVSANCTSHICDMELHVQKGVVAEELNAYTCNAIIYSPACDDYNFHACPHPNGTMAHLSSRLRSEEECGKRVMIAKLLVQEFFQLWE
jgi:hypothetical protein